jgi:CheY-like chemotaxis protein
MGACQTAAAAQSTSVRSRRRSRIRAPLAARRGRAHSPEVPHSDCRILVIDDDEDIREALRDVLTEDGYRVDLAENGREALAFMRRRGRPDLVLLDLMMPVMNGWEFLHEKSRDDDLNAVPVLVVSANPPASLLEEHVRGVMRKPVQLEQLRSAVAQVCRA